MHTKYRSETCNRKIVCKIMHAKLRGNNLEDFTRISELYATRQDAWSAVAKLDDPDREFWLEKTLA